MPPFSYRHESNQYSKDLFKKKNKNNNNNHGAYLASRKRDLRIMTASHVLCFSWVWIELNLRWMIATIRSISLGVTGRVRDCSLSRFMTWVVNSVHAWIGGGIRRRTVKDRNVQSSKARCIISEKQKLYKL